MVICVKINFMSEKGFKPKGLKANVPCVPVVVNHLRQLCTKTMLNIYITILSGEPLFSYLCICLCLICVYCHAVRKHVSHLERYKNLTAPTLRRKSTSDEGPSRQHKL